MKITKSQLKQLIKEELESVVQENEKAYDARRELHAIVVLLKQAVAKMEDLQSNVYGKGYSNEQSILDLAGEIYHVAGLAEKSVGL